MNEKGRSSFRRSAAAISIVTAAAGVVVMGGWFLDIGVLKSVLPGLVSMKFNTALLFLLTGVSPVDDFLVLLLLFLRFLAASRRSVRPPLTLILSP